MKTMLRFVMTLTLCACAAGEPAPYLGLSPPQTVDPSGKVAAAIHEARRDRGEWSRRIDGRGRMFWVRLASVPELP